MTPKPKPKPIPDAYRRVTPCLIVRGGVKALEFYGRVFDATKRMRFTGPDATIAHAEIQIGDSVVMVEDESPERGTKAPPTAGADRSPSFLFIYVEDVDDVVARAVKLGATLRRSPQNQFYGDRDGYIMDPFGHGWTIATHVEDVDPEEMGRRMASCRARAAARFDLNGGLVLLRDQDRSQWDRDAIANATQLLARAARRGRPGPYQLQAAIVACHAEAERWEETDWEQIVLLYAMLLHLAPSPVTQLHRAIALRYTVGPRAAMFEVDALGGALDDYHLFHATRADLLRQLGDPDEARAADRRALAVTTNPAERAVLQQRIEA